MAGQAELTRQQRRSLAEHGYLLLPSVLDADVEAALAARLDELARATIAEAETVGQWEEARVVRARLDPAYPGYAPAGPAALAVQRRRCGDRARLRR